jgi:hypothetical protein
LRHQLIALFIQMVFLIPEQVGILVLHIAGQIQIGHLLLLQVANQRSIRAWLRFNRASPNARTILRRVWVIGLMPLMGKLEPLQRAADEFAF